MHPCIIKLYNYPFEQVLTNGRFRSVRHRVMVSSPRPRVSVIFFAGPPLRERLAPLPWLVAEDGGRRRYREFTWREYKASAYRTKLAENRLCHFETEADWFYFFLVCIECLYVSFLLWFYVFLFHFGQRVCNSWYTCWWARFSCWYKQHTTD